MLKLAVVVTQLPSDNAVRVQYSDDDDMVSADLQVPQRRTLGRCSGGLPKIGEQVAVITKDDGRGEGVVIGSIYSQEDKLPEGMEEMESFDVFEDGTVIAYDSKNGKLFIHAKCDLEVTTEKTLTINVEGDTILKCPNIKFDGDVSITGNLEVSGNQDIQGNITAQGEVSATPTGTKLSTHIHPTGVGPSGSPTPGT